MKKIIYLTLVVFIIGLLSYGCKTNSTFSEEVSPQKTETETMGRFKLLFTADSGRNTTMQFYTNGDNSFNITAKEDVLSLVITVEGLTVHKNSGPNAGWVSLTIEESTFDLIALDANGWAEIMANTKITPGTYNNLRFAVKSASVTTDSGVYDAEVPSGKLQVNLQFTVNDDGTTEVTIEIDPKASLKISGPKDNPKYKLVPVLKVTDVDEVDDEEDPEDDDD